MGCATTEVLFKVTEVQYCLAIEKNSCAFVWLGFVCGLLTVNAISVVPGKKPSNLMIVWRSWPGLPHVPIPPEFPTIALSVPGSKVPPWEGVFPLQPKLYFQPYKALRFTETKLELTCQLSCNLLHRESCYRAARCFAHPPDFPYA